MQGSWTRRLALLTLAAVMALGGVASGAAVPFQSAKLGGSLLVSAQDPEIDGALVVWTSFLVADPGDPSIAVHDLTDGTNEYIGSGNDSEQLDADVSLGRIAYEDRSGASSDIRIWDRKLALDFAVASTTDDEVEPRIDGNLVIWRNDSTGRLWYRDLGRGFSSAVPDATDVYEYDVDNGRIVWVGGLVQQEMRMYAPGISSTDSTLLWTAPIGDDVESLQVHGDRIAFTHADAADDDALILDLRSLDSVNLNPASIFNERLPVVFHKGAAWMTGQSGTYDVFFRLIGDAVTNVAGSTAEERDPAIFGRRIAYEYNEGGPFTSIWLASGTPEAHRSAGPDRYSTATRTSRAYFEAAEDAVLCTGLNFPDALAAAPFAKLLGAPLLLTRPTGVDTATMEELERLGVTTVWIVGGASVVPEAITDQLNDAGIHVRRIAGEDRYETSAMIAAEMADRVHGSYTVRRAFFARGDNFPDALAVGPVAAGALSPILLVRTGEVPATVAQAVDTINLTSGIIVGGSDVVTNDVKGALRTLMIANGGDDMDPMIVDRWAGNTRYETAIAIVEGGLEARWIDLDTLGIATGLNFPDALGGGAALGYYGSGLLLTTPDAVPASVATFLDDHDYEVGRVDVFGGSDVVSDVVMNAIAATLK